MQRTLRRFLHILLFIAAIVYPALMFCFLVLWKMPLRLIALFLLAIGGMYFLAGTSTKGIKKGGTRLVSAGMLLCIGFACLITNSAFMLKLYPVLINGFFLCFFGSTLVVPPPMIYRFAVLQDKSIRGSLAEKRIQRYCRKVTVVWCCFFIANGSIACYTVFAASDALWSIYNGGISYLLIGMLFAGEYIIRKMTDKKMPKAIPLSAFRENSRDGGTILCYEQTWGSGTYKAWRDFLEDTAKLRWRVQEEEFAQKWILFAEDSWYFLVAFTALLQCRKTILLTANISPAYIEEIRDANTLFLSDQESAEGALRIQAILESTAPLAGPIPEINRDETRILMYTSGTTGKPKAVEQRLTEFEMDNAFIISQWGEEFLKRKLVSTVSQHHIYGLLFSIFLPFTLGIPFRRSRILFPEEFESLADEPYMIITVPAFLKRACEALEKLPLKDPWIFTSSGLLTPEVAASTDEIFGFWPVEIYGSTETSGIAYRQSKNGLAWTPFDNAQIEADEDGRLVVRSVYIKDPAGFITGDLMEALEDGRFLLKGRADSIVKIEGKRISLPEVESRIIQSNLVQDACVIALEDRRQYLAAALAFNAEGEEKFKGWDKQRINRFFSEHLLQFFENTVLPKKWRYLQSLPMDSQGKKKKEEIEALFQQGDEASMPVSGMRTIPPEQVKERTPSQVVLELEIPQDCEYFDGHFPDFMLLPAVAQFELVLRLASRYFGTPLDVSKLRRIKFSSIIYPNAKLQVALTYRESQRELAFKIADPTGDRVYSSGAAIFTPGAPTPDMPGELPPPAGTLA